MARQIRLEKESKDASKLDLQLMKQLVLSNRIFLVVDEREDFIISSLSGIRN